MKRAAIASVLALLAAACATPRTVSAPPGPVTIGVIAINDFHGNLEPPKLSVIMPIEGGGTAAVPAGGAAWLASAIGSLRAKYENHVTVSAGDLVGASPLVSAIFADEPTIGVMNSIGLDFDAVGNHEFDSGTAELLRKQNGGCDPFTKWQPCQLEKPFKGATFRFLAANVKRRDGSGTLFPGSAIRTFGTGPRKVTVGFIGMTLKGTSSLVTAKGIEDVMFTDEAETANALVPALKAQGADAVVLLIHEGGVQSGSGFPGGCEGFSGAIRAIAEKLDPAIDVIVSGHTHRAYVCDGAQLGLARPLLLTSAGMGGTLVTEITLEVDPAADRVISARATNWPVQSVAYTGAKGSVPINSGFDRFEPNREIAEYVARYVKAAEPTATARVGTLSGPAAQAGSGMGGPLGNLVADAQLAATKADGAQIAFTNPFGLRADLVPEADGSVNFGAVFAVQPFSNMLVTLDLTGAQIKAALEQGFMTPRREQVLAASQGFSWTFDRSRPIGDRVVMMALNGTLIDPAAHYRVTVNTFLAGGGDGFTVFTQGRQAAGIKVGDLEALEAWIKAVPVRGIPQEERAIAVTLPR